jgi:hypothetical protein
MKIALKKTNSKEWFGVFLAGVTWDTSTDDDEELSFEDEIEMLGPNQYVGLDKDECWGFISELTEIDTIDTEDIHMAALEKLSDNAGFCVLDSRISRIVYHNDDDKSRFEVRC